MTLQERLEYAERRLDEEIRNGESSDISYWKGYRDALKRIMEDETNNGANKAN